MKQLIRKILKEETKDYKLVEKGIDVVVSMLNKDYPFVVGWKKNGDWEESTYYLYIDLVVDYKRVKEYYNLPLKSYYINYPHAIEELIQKGEGYAYATSLLDYDQTGEDPYLESKKIKSTLEDAYELIPIEYKLIYEKESVFGDMMKIPKDVSVSYYRFI